MFMIQSEGITENVKGWRTDDPARIIEKGMFKADGPDVFAWYIKNYRLEVNLFVDHSQLCSSSVCSRGIRGTASLWGHVIAHKEQQHNLGKTVALNVN